MVTRRRGLDSDFAQGADARGERGTGWRCSRLGVVGCCATASALDLQGAERGSTARSWACGKEGERHTLLEKAANKEMVGFRSAGRGWPGLTVA